MTPSDRPDPPAPVDELRQRLRSLGYLDAGVDRFVLAPAQGARGAAAIALLASVRIGLLAGLLLGPAAALGIAMQLPAFVTGVRDGVIIAIYMAVLFGAAVAVAAMATGLAITAMARRAGPAIARHGRMLSTIAGVVVAAGSLAYLTLMWTAVRGAGAAAHAGLWAGAGVAVAVAISLLLGHAVTLTALAIMVAGTGAPMRTRGVPGATWPAMLGAGAAAFGGALLLFNAGMRAAPAAPDPIRLTVVPSGVRIRVIAVDGFDPALADRLIAARRLPALAAASQGSVTRLVLNDVDPAENRAAFDPARLWTTIATAQPAKVHGVETLETRRVAGMQGVLQGGEGSAIARVVGTGSDLLRLTRPSVASGTDRHEKTFWEVAADAGLRTAVVNWWATWPAAAENAAVLTDRATLRLERGGALDAEIAPAALYERLKGGWPALKAGAESTAARALEGAAADGTAAAVLRRSAEMDAVALALAGAVSDASTDLVVTYLPGLDIAQHALSGPAAAPAAAAALEAYYVALDALLAPVLQLRDGEIVVVVSAPGRGTSGAEGRLLIRGGNVRTGATSTARATDVAPTILYALGVPISGALAGSPLTDLFEPRFVTRYAVRHVPTYGRRDTRSAARTGRALDQEMIDRLRSLGYVR